MRFMLLMIPWGYQVAPPDTLPDLDAVSAMTDYNHELEEAGILLDAGGLHPPTAGVRVSFESGEPRVTPGPFPGVRETLGGYWMIDVPSQDQAIEWAMRCPASANEIIEVRRMQDLEDFPPEIRQILGDSPGSSPAG